MQRVEHLNEVIRSHEYKDQWIPKTPKFYSSHRYDTIKLILKITRYFESKHNWISTHDLMKEFNLGRKQVTRYMDVIGELIPLQYEEYKNMGNWKLFK